MITPYTLRTAAVPTIRLRPEVATIRVVPAEPEAPRLRRAIHTHLARLDRALCSSSVREFETHMAAALEILEAAL